MKPDVDFCCMSLGEVRLIGSPTAKYTTIYCAKPAVAWYVDSYDEAFSACVGCSTIMHEIGPAVSHDVAVVFALMRS